jgi:hypothetical protein
VTNVRPINLCAVTYHLKMYMWWINCSLLWYNWINWISAIFIAVICCGSWHVSCASILFGTSTFLCCSSARQRHCGLARHFKTDPTETVALCFGYAKTLLWRRRHCGLARHFKTDPTKTVALCFGYAKTLLWRAEGKADEQDICLLHSAIAIFTSELEQMNLQLALIWLNLIYNIH